MLVITTADGEFVMTATDQLVITESTTDPPPDPAPSGGGLGVQPLGTSPLGGTA